MSKPLLNNPDGVQRMYAIFALIVLLATGLGYRLVTYQTRRWQDAESLSNYISNVAAARDIHCRVADMLDLVCDHSLNRDRVARPRSDSSRNSAFADQQLGTKLDLDCQSIGMRALEMSHHSSTPEEQAAISQFMMQFETHISSIRGAGTSVASPEQLQQAWAAAYQHIIPETLKLEKFWLSKANAAMTDLFNSSDSLLPDFMLTIIVLIPSLIILQRCVAFESRTYLTPPMVVASVFVATLFLANFCGHYPEAIRCQIRSITTLGLAQTAVHDALADRGFYLMEHGHQQRQDKLEQCFQSKWSLIEDAGSVILGEQRLKQIHSDYIVAADISGSMEPLPREKIPGEHWHSGDSKFADWELDELEWAIKDDNEHSGFDYLHWYDSTSVALYEFFDSSKVVKSLDDDDGNRQTIGIVEDKSAYRHPQSTVTQEAASAGGVHPKAVNAFLSPEERVKVTRFLITLNSVIDKGQDRLGEDARTYVRNGRLLATVTTVGLPLSLLLLFAGLRRRIQECYPTYR